MQQSNNNQQANIQSMLYEFFTNKTSHLECRLETLAFLQFHDRANLSSQDSITKPEYIQTYSDIMRLWDFTIHANTIRHNQGLNYPDFLRYCNNIESNNKCNSTPRDPLIPNSTSKTLYHPKIIVCANDELELCYHALCFLESFHHLSTQQDLKINSNKAGITNSLKTDSIQINNITPIQELTNADTNTLPILLPDIRLNPYDSMQTFYEEFHELFAKLALWYENDCKQTLIAPPHTLMAFLPSKELLHSFTLKLHQNITIQSVIENLIHYGYESVEIVEMQGEFSNRGDILDIFIPNLDNPIRLSFFDTEIESIRYFSTETQLSQKEELDSIHIYPALFSLNKDQYKYLESCIESLQTDSIEKSFHALAFWFLKDIGGINFLQEYPHIFTLKALREYKENLEFILPEILPSLEQTFKILNFAQESKDMQPLTISNLTSTLRLNQDKQIFILSPTHALLKSLDIKINHNLTSIITPFYFNIFAKDSLFISLQKPHKLQKKKIKLELDSLKVGEFVVHSEYGIGIFECIKQVDIMGGLKDFISIVYANEDRLLLPVENLNMIEKYSAYDSVIKLDRLGRSSFLRLKDSIKEKLLEIANEIIKLQAQRELSKGAIISLESPEAMVAYKRFEETRGFELTSDQSLAIRESLKDLKSGKVMDRLLNGDVGFGKTEVAMSLCYASALNGYVSIVLVPTTLLCNQHFESFKQRLEGLELPYKHSSNEALQAQNLKIQDSSASKSIKDSLLSHTNNRRVVRIAKLDRFSTAKQKEALKAGIKDKSIQILIGTHSLFSLEFADLGLIVIDEEHKFGVKQKEILKQKGLHTHVLSMSATPIPRTLNMAYSKLKAISQLHTPPFFKQESKTFVKIKNDSLLKEVITRELRRGGQVFYIFNNIAKITTIKSYLLNLLPKLRILILHSQISPKDTEIGMLDFLNKRYNLLLCTSIVESGIHLPNANTIIIDEAHNFGIADLHQLRGRVGRGKAVGFCYLLTHQDIKEDASKRLLALEKNSYLGSGAQLAYHDLEIRGGGNLLGQAQSGHIKQVGFGMYVRMLEETLQNLLQTQTQDNKVDLKLSVSAFLNETLIASERMRLELYRRLSLAQTELEVREIEGEIEQRFGKLDRYSLQFLELIIIKILAMKVDIKAISNMGNKIVLTHNDNTKEYLQAQTKDDDDVLLAITTHLKTLGKPH